MALHVSRFQIRWFRSYWAIVVGIALTIAPTFTLAEVQVRGTQQAVSVNAQNASVEEILSAIRNAFGVRYRSSINLQQETTGTYEGSLYRVLQRILESYDFIVKTSEAGTEITIFGKGNALPATASEASRVPVPSLPTGSTGMPVPKPQPSTVAPAGLTPNGAAPMLVPASPISPAGASPPRFPSQ
jgi:hypothetical protein